MQATPDGRSSLQSKVTGPACLIRIVRLCMRDDFRHSCRLGIHRDRSVGLLSQVDGRLQSVFRWGAASRRHCCSAISSSSGRFAVGSFRISIHIGCAVCAFRLGRVLDRVAVTTPTQMSTFLPNKPDAVNPAMALWLTIEDQWRRVTDLER